MAEEEIEYESDPEEAKLSLKMRRKEASDDEEEDNLGGNRKPLREIDDSEAESEGAVAEYEDELDEEYGLDEEYFEEVVEEEDAEYEESGGDGVVVVVAEERMDSSGGGGGEVDGGTPLEGLLEVKKELHNESEPDYGNTNNTEVEHEEEKKEIEPFAVPTAGAFYMHDDRFRDSVGGQNRRTLGGRKLWESKDNSKWGHDKFEELTQERDRDEPRRGSRGRYRGRGRTRGVNHGYSQVNRARDYANNNNTQYNNNQNNAPKGVRGRGPRRYQPSSKNSNEPHIAPNRQYGKPTKKDSYVSSERTIPPSPNTESDMVLPKKHVSSNLSIASPPFYPTGSSSSTKDSTMPTKRDSRASTINRNGQQTIVDENLNSEQSVGLGKITPDSIGLDKLYIADPPSSVAGKPQNTIQRPVSSPLPVSPNQPQMRGQGRGPDSLSQMAYHTAVSSNVINRVPPSNQLQRFQRTPGQSRAQSSIQSFAQHLPDGMQASSPPKAVSSVTTFESREAESTMESNQVKSALVTKGKGGVQGSGKGSFLYGGAPVMGAPGSRNSGHSDQNFPSFLPVMQFGGQHPGGIGVPAVGMAFPGYVGQPHLGLGSSEMTWLPVLAGAAGALGASYCPPYITVDGSYNIRPSGQAPSTTSTSSKETNATKVGNDLKSTQKPELANDDFAQKQKNPRRYTEMKFD